MDKNRFSENIVCTYLYSITKYGYPPPASETLNYVDEMTSLGFRSIELEGIRKDHLLGVYDLRDDLAEKLKSENIALPFFCVVLPGLSSLNAEIRVENIGLFEKGCEIAQKLGASGVLDNAPLPPLEFPADVPVVRHYNEESIVEAKIPADLDWEKFWNDLTTTYRSCCDIADKYGLTFHVHPAVGLLASSADAFLHFYESVERPNLKVVFDTANQFYMMENLQLSMIRLKDHVEYIHLSDNRGTQIEHLEAGKGIISWDLFFETIKKVGFDGFIGIDVGGAESEVPDLDSAYIKTAKFIENKMQEFDL